MPTRSGPGTQQEDMLMIIGRLLEGAKYTADALKVVTEEVKQTTASAHATQQALVSLQRTVEEIDKLLRGNGSDAIAGNQRALTEKVHSMASEMHELSEKMEIVTKRVDADEKDTASKDGGHRVAIAAFTILAWTVTTLIAIFAAMGQWKAAGSNP